MSVKYTHAKQKKALVITIGTIAKDHPSTEKFSFKIVPMP
jgi:hypothetical protein